MGLCAFTTGDEGRRVLTYLVTETLSPITTAREAVAIP
jgi:hypothetical protein